MTVSLFVRIRTRPGARDGFLARVARHRKTVLANEPYCQRFDVMVPEDSEDQVCLYEVYDDEAALKAHAATPHMEAYRADTADMVMERNRLLSTVVE